MSGQADEQNENSPNRTEQIMKLSYHQRGKLLACIFGTIDHLQRFKGSTREPIEELLEDINFYIAKLEEENQ